MNVNSNILTNNTYDATINDRVSITHNKDFSRSNIDDQPNNAITYDHLTVTIF